MIVVEEPKGVQPLFSVSLGHGPQRRRRRIKRGKERWRGMNEAMNVGGR